MASHEYFLSLLLLAGLVGTLQAFQFHVGGGDGWVPNPRKSFNDYSQRLRFQVNDTLFFKYKKGSDSVLVVNKDDYDNCNTQKPIMKMEDGESTFKLDRSGPFYFISGIKGHCEKGQKMVVVVMAVRSNKPKTHPPPPAQSPTPVVAPGPAASLSPAPAVVAPSVSTPSPSPAAVSPAPVSTSPAAPMVAPSPYSVSPSSSTPSPISSSYISGDTGPLSCLDISSGSRGGPISLLSLPKLVNSVSISSSYISGDTGPLSGLALTGNVAIRYAHWITRACHRINVTITDDRLGPNSIPARTGIRNRISVAGIVSGSGDGEREFHFTA